MTMAPEAPTRQTSRWSEGLTTIDGHMPSGPIAERWGQHKFDMKLVNPSNRRRHHIIVVGSGLAGASAAATLGEAGYQVLPNQHVLFEHGSLKAVVDSETTPCGCPPEDLRPVPLAEAILNGNGVAVTPQQAAAANPFPVAQSEGLAPAPPLPSSKPGEINTQVSTSLIFDPTAPRSAPQLPATQVAPPPPLPPPPEPAKGGPFRAVGRFFKRIFVR